MATIELTTATQTQLSGIAATLSPPVLSSLPAVNASKAGELFYLNGTLWTYAKTGQFGTLAEGTPWPVKGYKVLLLSAGDSTINPTVIYDDSLDYQISTNSNIISVQFVGAGDFLDNTVAGYNQNDESIVAMIGTNDGNGIYTIRAFFDGAPIAYSMQPHVQFPIKIYPPQS